MEDAHYGAVGKDPGAGYIVQELHSEDLDEPDTIIRWGADTAQSMLSDPVNGGPAITVGSMVPGTAFAASTPQSVKVSR